MIGRKKEIEILRDAYENKESRFIAVYGRRRVGKTYLIKEVFKNKITFSHSGINTKDKKSQLQAFTISLEDYGVFVERKITEWMLAFQEIKKIIVSSTTSKKVIFLDEISWMDTPKSNFIAALEFFWNGWASKRDDILLIVCGSSASYILNKVIHNKGGLYNRINYSINLMPFSLNECKNYLIENGFTYDDKSILDLYMVLGGIPFYYTHLKKDLSSVQNINNLLFKKDAPLINEYEALFKSMYSNYFDYIELIECLYSKKSGMSRKEITDELGLSSGGDLSEKLLNLENCGFIRSFNKYGQVKKEKNYQLIDNFVLFYHFFKNEIGKDDYWINNYNTQKVSAWSGLAFEIVTFQHINKIKDALQIGGIDSNAYSYRIFGSDLSSNGAQIDLVLDRSDNQINLCEIKYSKAPYSIDKDTSLNISNKLSKFLESTKTRKSVNVILITTYALKDNMYANNVAKVIKLENFF